MSIFSKWTQFFDVDDRSGIPCSPLIVGSVADDRRKWVLCNPSLESPIVLYSKAMFLDVITVGVDSQSRSVDQSLQLADDAVGCGASITLFRLVMTRGSNSLCEMIRLPTGAIFRFKLLDNVLTQIYHGP